MASTEVEILYSKQLTQSDAACSKQIKLPRNEAKKFVGDLRHKQSAALVVKDAQGAYWEFICTCYGCQYALSKVGAFAKAFSLKPGDTLSFYRDENNELRIAVNHHLVGGTVGKPRTQTSVKKKRASFSDDGSPTHKARKCAGASSPPVSPKSKLGQEPAQAAEGERERCAAATERDGCAPEAERDRCAAESETDRCAAEAGHSLHEQLGFGQLRLPVVFSGSGSAPSSPLGEAALLRGALMGQDQLRRSAEPWQMSSALDQQQLDSLQAVLLLQTLESLNSGPALFKRPEPSQAGQAQRRPTVTMPPSPIQIPDCVSPVKQLNSPYDKSPGRTDHSNLSEDTQGHLDVLDDSAAGCSTPELTPTGGMKALVLFKQLSRMDVRCAHDSVGITFCWEDVAASQLMDGTAMVKQFQVVDELWHTVLTCALSRSADGRFCYLTGLGPFLKMHAAQPGQSLCLYVNPMGALVVALHR